MTTSIYLIPDTWDMTADVNGNIAVCTDPYRLAQDEGCAIKLWLGELYYDTTQGVNWPAIYGKLPPASYVRNQLVQAARSVVGSVNPKVFFTSFNQRVLSGQVQDSGIAVGF